MAITAKVTSKGQITLPRSAREALGSNVVGIEIEQGRVLLRPVRSMAGALRDFAKKDGKSLNEIRGEVWEEVVRDRQR